MVLLPRHRRKRPRPEPILNSFTLKTPGPAREASSRICKQLCQDEFFSNTRHSVLKVPSSTFNFLGMIMALLVPVEDALSMSSGRLMQMQDPTAHGIQLDIVLC